MLDSFNRDITQRLSQIRSEGAFRSEQPLSSPQGSRIRISGNPLLNLCSNDYLGLASDPRIVEAANEASRRWGAGTASVRFICGTFEIHKQLEHAIARYLGYEDAMLFAAAFDANGAVFEPLFDERDAIISDALNHASIIDGVRLSKARRHRYETGDMNALEDILRTARRDGSRHLVIVTDGVFSMDGTRAELGTICTLAAHYDTLVMVDDCHATGVLGERGRGTAAQCHVEGQIDILTGTFGKALGGAMGGFVCSSASVISLLRHRARPYLFSNALAPAVCGASLAAIDIAESGEGDRRREQLFRNAALFRSGFERAGYTLVPGEHPIIPVMIGDAQATNGLAAALRERDVHVTGFTYPVVPKHKDRIRVQASAAMSDEDVSIGIEMFMTAGKSTGYLG